MCTTTKSSSGYVWTNQSNLLKLGKDCGLGSGLKKAKTDLKREKGLSIPFSYLSISIKSYHQEIVRLAGNRGKLA